jgi:MFS family permease
MTPVAGKKPCPAGIGNPLAHGRPNSAGLLDPVRQGRIVGRTTKISPLRRTGRDRTEEDIAMASAAAASSMPWYKTLNREQWRVLIASNLAWLFDGFEIYALFLTVGFALHQLLEAAQYKAIPEYAGYVLAATVFGWATGGVIGGIIADYIGRKRTMMLAILAYSLTTGLSAVAWNWESFAVLRFLVGVGIGSEWATGASIVSELWPDHARGKGGGLLQSGAGIGSFIASGVWLVIGGLGPNAWRFMYLVGILPALLVLWIWRGMPESGRWEAANARRRQAQEMRRRGVALEGEHAMLARFTVVDMFANKNVRGRLIGAFLMMLSVTPVGTLLLGDRGAARHRGRDFRLRRARLLRRLDRPQADGDDLVRHVPGADAGRLSVGKGHAGAARRRRDLRLLHRRHLVVGADLAAGIVPDAHARHGGRLLLQCAALDLRVRPADRRHADRRARRFRAGGDDRRAVLHRRPRGGAVHAGDQWQAAARGDRSEVGDRGRAGANWVAAGAVGAAAPG